VDIVKYYCMVSLIGVFHGNSGMTLHGRGWMHE